MRTVTNRSTSRTSSRASRIGVRSILLASVAALTALVGACGDSSGVAPAASDETILPDSAEQGVFGYSTKLTENSVAKGDLLADTAYSYDSGNRWELRRVNVTFFNEIGEQDGTMTAREGTYNLRLNRLEARGDVVIIRGSEERLESQQIVYDELRDQIFSDSAFVLNQPPKRQITGIGFESDPQLTKFRVLKAFKGVAPVTVENP